MKAAICGSLACLLTHTSFAAVTATVGEISDKRTTGKFFAGLEIELKLAGPELATAKGIRTTVTAATDDAGNPLKKKENTFSAGGFEELQKAFGGGFEEKKADEFQVKLEFANPPRAAKAIKSISGSIDLLLPQQDPASVVTASVAKDAGKPLDNAALKAAGVEIKLLKPEPGAKKPAGIGFSFAANLGENDLGYEIKDPKKKVAGIEFFSAAGKKLESQSHMSSGFNDSKTVSISFKEKPGADSVAKIYIVTEKSVLTVPLNLKDIALP
jgi:hypothetical protein